MTARPAKPPRRSLGRARVLLVALLLPLAGWGVVRAWSYGLTWRGLDFYQFWVVGQSVASTGRVDVYSEAGRERIGREYAEMARRPGAPERLRSATERRQVLETYSTPFLYATFRAASSGAYERDYRVFLAVGLAFGVLGVVAIGWTLRYPLPAILAAVAVLTIAFAPFASDVRVGNVARIQLGLVAALLAVAKLPDPRWRAAAVGCVAGIAILFKPNLAPVALMLVVSWAARGRFKELRAACAGSIAAAGVALGTSSLLFGSPAVWGDWLAAARAIPADITLVRMGNFSPVRLLRDLVGIDAGPWLGVALAVATAGAAWIGGRRAAAAAARREDALDVALLAGAGCLVHLLSAPLVWTHYVVLAIPAAMVSLRPGESGGVVPRQALGAAAVVLLAGRPLEILVGTSDPVPFALASAAGAALLYALAWTEIVRGPRRVAGDRRRATVETGLRRRGAPARG